MSRIAIVDSGCANVASVTFALERLGARPDVTSERARIEGASHVVLPGVGSARTFMKRLRERGLVDCVRQLAVPCLGICLGMQVLFEASAEGDTETLGVLPGRVLALPRDRGVTLPHMGWNALETVSECPLLSELEPGSYAYFVHGYYAPRSEITRAVVQHGVEISAVVSRDNFFGCQFHPERSARTGATVLRNFLGLS